MMNKIWSIILIASIIYAFINGSIASLEAAITASSTKAVEFVFGFCGIMALWSGLMEIAEETGLIKKLSLFLLPLTKLLFPSQKDSDILSTMIMSFMANIFGAGNSSTVFALKAMEKLDRQNNNSIIASSDMCMFAVVNMGFAPIFPLMTLQIRNELGSSEPYSIILPSIITAFITIIVSAASCRFFERRSR